MSIAQLYDQARLVEEAEHQRSEELGGLLKVSSILGHPGSKAASTVHIVSNTGRIDGGRPGVGVVIRR